MTFCYRSFALIWPPGIYNETEEWVFFLAKVARLMAFGIWRDKGKNIYSYFELKIYSNKNSFKIFDFFR